MIQKGIPGTEMPRSRLPILDLWKLTAYVRGLARAGVPETVSGDPAAGAEVYTRQQCSQCHVIDSKGGALGPELTRVGLRRPLVFLREALVEPDKYVPRKYQSASAVDGEGKKVSGVVVNQDDFTIQLRDADDALYSFSKQELRSWSVHGESAMPPYGAALSGEELQDLLAFLKSLQGVSQ